MTKEELHEILSHVDHTQLKVAATAEDIRELCADAAAYHTASVCVAPCYVAQAKEFLEGCSVAVCTVIGFPNGYQTTASKVFEAADAVGNGADEIDMVINVGMVKDACFDAVTDEIRAVKTACGKALLKVIVEACLLTQEEKVAVCHCVTDAGADFIKTSTGFSTGGATREDVKLFAENIGKGVRIKAAGGIRTLEDAVDYLALGCDRLGTSALVSIAKNTD